jgi:small-conductance mechanosensitive channel/CRP-like cAMP-binding protein
MNSSELKKRFAAFVIFGGAVAFILVVLPFVEPTLKGYVASFFGIAEAEGGHMSQTAASLFETILKIFKIILWMGFVIAVVRLLNSIVADMLLRNTGSSELSVLIRNVISIIIYVVTFTIIVKSQFDTDLTTFFAGSTIVGVVLGLALQDTLGNLFSGIATQADQPFQIGDVINIANRGSGVVESISWRGVKIRTFQNKLLVISNSVLGKETFEVAPRDNLNARIVFFNTIYSSSPAKTIHLIRDAVQKVENVSPKIRPVVRIRNLGDNGIDYEVKYWLEDYTKYNDTDALVRQRIWYVFQREQIHFAFPTRTLYVEKQGLEPDFTESVNDIFERLSDVPIFAPLSDEETMKIAESVEAKIFSPDEPIVKRGQEGSSMYVIHRGAVKVQIREAGQPKVIRTLKDGDFFGEMGLFTGEPRTATVIATEETEVLEIKHTCLKPILEDNPDLVERFGDIIAERRIKLIEAAGKAPAAAEADSSGVFRSIRKFFGLKS